MRKILTAVLAAASGAACLAGLALAGAPLTADAEWTDVGLEEEYVLGSQLTVPARSLTVNGKTADAVSVLHLPDGTATVAAQTTLDMTGVWTLSYTAELGGVTYRTDEQFEVYEKIASVGGNSAAAWGNYVFPTTGEQTDTQGLQVRLAQGETLAFSPIIDLSDATKDDTLIEFFVTPTEIGAVDFEKIIITLTDAEDENCYLRISGRQSSDGINYPYTYFLAGGNGQPMAGWEGGSHNKLHVNNEWGSSVQHSFYGLYGGASTKPDAVRLSVRFDAATNSVYVGQNFVIDLDSTQYFSTLWEGFPSGRVRVSVTADVYSGSYANFMVTKLMGVDLTQERLSDTAAPVITVDTPYAEAPDAEPGRAYPIPSASAKDDYSGECPVTAQVWYNFTSANAVSVPVSDGTFTPTRMGLYAIVYRAEDASDNAAQKIVWVRSVADVPDVRLTLGATQLTAKAGETVELPAVTATGGSGNISVSVKAISGGEETAVKDSFRPVKAGTYTLIFTATDHIGQTATAECKVEVAPNEVPVFTEKAQLPRYLFSGSTYSVPALYATDYSGSEPQRIPASVYVTDALGERRVEGTFTPTVFATGDKVTIGFRVEGAPEKEYVIPAVVPFVSQDGRMRLQMQNYFVTDGASAEAGEDAVTVTAQRADGSFTFANRLLAEGLTFTLAAVPARSAFDALEIVLEDSLDASAKLAFAIERSGSVSAVRIGASRIQLSAGFMTTSSGNAFTALWRDGALTVNGVTIPVPEGFAGFPSGYAYLTVSFENAEAGGAYQVTDINDQPIVNAAADRIKPKIAVYGTYGDAAQVGSEQIVPRALAGDVLDPNVTLLLTVTDPSGNAMTAADGTLLKNVVPDREFTITLTGYGRYFVSYVARDTFNGRDFELGYTILAEDREAPVITFAHDFASEGKVGEAIVIPDFTVSDNVTAAEDLRIAKFVLTPGGQLVELKGASNAFRPTQAGTFEVRVVVTDEAGNIAMIRHTVTVTE